MASHPARKRIWTPVIDQSADSFWLLLITAMSVTVLVTRIFLDLAGYPQIGDSTYHIAHVLWGGLLLFVAVTLPLSTANRYALWVSALLGGVGVGLFIDEVGKFITQSNDYFFPLAIPIIYSFILVCVWLFYRIRRRKPRDARTLLYHALEDMKQVLDNDLDPFEHRELVSELQQVLKETHDPNELRLAQSLLDFVQSRDVRLAIQPNPLERMLNHMRHWLAGWPPQLILKGILVVGFGFMAFQALATLLQLVAATQQEGELYAIFASYTVVSGKSEYTVSHPILLLLTTFSVIGVGLLALVAMLLLLAGRDHVGVRIGVLGLVIALSIVNLFTFYFNQLAAATEAVMQVALLGVATLYRWRFLAPSPALSELSNQERRDEESSLLHH